MLERRAVETDTDDLSAFYASGIGAAARRAIAARLATLWPSLNGLSLLGYGFTAPYLSAFGAARAVCAHPAGIAPDGGLVCAEDALPFADALFDRILVVHGLEGAEALRPLLRQLWRVLAPEGRILVVAPNRASLWAQVETTPFGQGRPFRHGELNRLLREALFQPLRSQRALYAPPLSALVGTGRNWERAGALAFPGLGGVHLVEASKTLYAVTPLAVTDTAVPATVVTN